jgi:hypothetical protein
MRGRTAALVATLLVASACGREGRIAATPTSVSVETPPPIAIPAPPPTDDRPVVWAERSDKVALRVEMTPGRPVIGDLVRFDVKMTYGDAPYRPGGFDYTLLVDEVGGESASASCGLVTFAAGSVPKPPRPFDDNMHRKYRYFEPGPHSFSLEIRPSCYSVGGVWMKREFSVRGTRPVEGLHRTGSDFQRQVDLLISPRVTKQDHVAHLYAIFEDRTGEPFSWRVSFGDGRRPVAGGPACKRGAASRDGRYVRRFEHTWSAAAEYDLRVEVARECLSDARSRGAFVIAERLYVRPRTIHFPGRVALPSHLWPPLHPERLGPVKLVVDARGCVYIERMVGPDPEMLQVVWPAGSWLLAKPLGVTTGGVIWKAGKVRKDVRVLGSGPVDVIPKRCRIADRALLIAPLPD